MINKLTITAIIINAFVGVWCVVNVMSFEAARESIETNSFKFKQLPEMTQKAIEKMKSFSKEEREKETERVSKLYVQLSNYFKVTHKSADASFRALWFFSFVFLVVSVLNMVLFIYMFRYNNSFNFAHKKHGPDAQ